MQQNTTRQDYQANVHLRGLVKAAFKSKNLKKERTNLQARIYKTQNTNTRCAKTFSVVPK